MKYLLIVLSLNVFAAEEPIMNREIMVGNRKVIYTYKQFEKFDFDDINIEAEIGAPGDISISPMADGKYNNRLPYRKSFIPEIKRGLERVR